MLPSTPKIIALARAAATALLLAASANAGGASDPWLDSVPELVPGEFAGFGADRLPRVALGPPRGGGLLQGGTHVVSLGHGGTITVAFRDNAVADGPGDDLVVFENAFYAGSAEGPLFDEVGVVSVSADGKTWVEFPYDALTGEGLAGNAAVYSSPTNDIDPLSPEAGGDRYDISTLGLAFVRFVRIVDGGDAIPDNGDLAPPANKGGFDLDAMAALNSVPTGEVSGTVSAAGAPVARALVLLAPSDGSHVMRRRTRADGTFRFRPVLPSGGYELTARRRGVGSAAQDVEVLPDALLADAQLELETTEAPQEAP
jgi:hypothetical protein